MFWGGLDGVKNTIVELSDQWEWLWNQKHLLDCNRIICLTCQKFLQFVPLTFDLNAIKLLQLKDTHIKRECIKHFQPKI